MGRLFVGAWDCGYCGRKGISGEERDCPGCGKPRGEDVTFYLDRNRREVENPDSVNKNPDWLCSFCGSLNSDSVKTCSSCGHGRDEGDPNYFDAKRTLHKMSLDNGHFDKDDSLSGGFEDLIYEQEEYKKKEKRRKKLIRAALLGGVLLLCIALALIFIPKTKTITVQELNWERTVAVEQYRTVEDSSWELPDGAYNVTERQEIQSYNHVISHYETHTKQVPVEVYDGDDVSYSYVDLGNGMFEQVEHRTPRYRTEYKTETYEEPVYVDIPVYGTKYYYNIERWVFDHNEETSGTDGRAYFANVDVRDGVTRAGDTTERYWITDSNRKQYKMEYELWNSLRIGQTVTIKTFLRKVINIIP